MPYILTGSSHPLRVEASRRVSTLNQRVQEHIPESAMLPKHEKAEIISPIPLFPHQGRTFLHRNARDVRVSSQTRRPSDN